MSKFVLNDPQDNGFQDGFINDVTFLYATLQTGKKKYKSEELEYSVDCVVDEETADAFEKEFPKNKVKKVATDEFETIYGVPAPFPNEKKQYIVKLKADVTDREGNLIAYDRYKRPKVYVPTVGGKGVKDITKEILVANGSKGDVNYFVSTNDFGTFPKLVAIRVTDLIVYEKASSGSAWGEVEGNSNERSSAKAFEEQQKEDAPETGSVEDDKF